jgi:hypothetical protein
MPLDWAVVSARYGKGAEVPTVAGNKILQITGVDEEKIHIKSPLWVASLSRSNLEKGVELIEEGLIDRQPGQFVEDYKVYVADERATSAAHVLKDLGFLTEDLGYYPTC